MLQVFFAIKLQTKHCLLWAGLSKKKEESFFHSNNFLSDNCQQKAALGARKFFKIRIFPEVKLPVIHPVNDWKLSA